MSFGARVLVRSVPAVRPLSTYTYTYILGAKPNQGTWYLYVLPVKAPWVAPRGGLLQEESSLGDHTVAVASRVA